MPTIVAVRRYDRGHGSHEHDFPQLLFGMEGSLDLEVTGHLAHIAAGTGFIIPPGLHHDFEGRDGSTCLVLDLTESLDEADRMFERARTVRIAAKDGPLLRYLADELIRTPEDPLLQAATPSLLLRVLSRDPAPLNRSRLLPMPALIAYVDANLSRSIGNAELAARCFLSTAQFQARFMAETNTTPQAFVRDRRLQCALRLLDEGKPVAVVAAQVGYQSPSALTSALRRVRGMTARDWIKRSGRF